MQKDSILRQSFAWAFSLIKRHQDLIYSHKSLKIMGSTSYCLKKKNTSLTQVGATALFTLLVSSEWKHERHCHLILAECAHYD